MLALIELPSTFIGLIGPGGWFDIPGVGRASPAEADWTGHGFALLQFMPAEAPPDRKRRIGDPAYVVEGGVCTEIYELEEILVTVADVLVERERRLALGFDYDFGDTRGVHRIGTTSADMVGWAEVTQLSQAAIALGNGTASIQIITETGPASVSAVEWQSILLAAGARRQPIWAASFALQLTDPIPADYANDLWWP